MKKIILIIIAFLSSLNLYSQTPDNDPHWELVWSDEFEEESINTSKWNVLNNYDQYCANPTIHLGSNSRITNGNLEMELNPIPYPYYTCPHSAVNPWGCVCQYNNSSHKYKYKTGGVETQPAYATQYGYIEARLSMPYNINFTGAFWTFIKQGISYIDDINCVESDVNASEIDIVEFKGNLEQHNLFNPSQYPKYITTCIHRCYNAKESDGITDYFWKYAKCYKPDNFEYGENIWHTYAIEWSPYRLIFYIDGKAHRIINNHMIFQPVRLLLGLNLMPNTPENANIPNSSKMLVDYVRVYNLKKDCSTEIINLCNYDFSNYVNTVKQKIIIGDGYCTNSLNAGDNIFLRASEEITINGEFEIPLGAEIYLDVDKCEK
ncbi:MAG: family 16 glycosylhydrolase [Bacteroidales bacterium]